MQTALISLLVPATGDEAKLPGSPAAGVPFENAMAKAGDKFTQLKAANEPLAAAASSVPSLVAAGVSHLVAADMEADAQAGQAVALVPFAPGEEDTSLELVVDTSGAVEEALPASAVPTLFLLQPTTPVAVSEDNDDAPRTEGAAVSLVATMLESAKLPEAAVPATDAELQAVLLKPVAELTLKDIVTLGKLAATLPEIKIALPEIAEALDTHPENLPEFNIMEMLANAEGKLYERMMAQGGKSEEQTDEIFPYGEMLAEVYAEMLNPAASGGGADKPKKSASQEIQDALGADAAEEVLDKQEDPSAQAGALPFALVPQATDAAAVATLAAASLAPVPAAAAAVSGDDADLEIDLLNKAGSERTTSGLATAAERAPSSLSGGFKALHPANSAQAKDDAAKSLTASVKANDNSAVKQGVPEQAAEPAKANVAFHSLVAAQDVVKTTVVNPGNAVRALHSSHTHTPVHEQISVSIKSALADGSSKIQINLEPAELGRVEVRMDVSQDGRTGVVVTVDNKDTLDLLQRDARSLERALNDAGLKTDSGSLSFNLRGDQNNGDGQQQAGSQRGGYAPVDSAELDPLDFINPLTGEYTMQLTPGVNIQV